MVRSGRVQVAGSTCLDPGRRVDPASTLTVDGQPVAVPRDFALFFKPAGVQCTVGDPWGRTSLREAADALLLAGLHPVGRLDADSRGLLPFCREGEVTQRLLHPRHAIEKTYLATVEGTPGPALVDELLAGVATAEGTFAARSASVTGHVVTVVVAEGKHRMVRRMLANAGFPVTDLLRVRFGGWTLGSMEPGTWRFPDDAENAWLQPAGPAARG